jgi:serine/threonine protein phosphatase PrpC
MLTYAAEQALTTYAIRNGSNDNVTCMIVALEAGSGGGPL